MNQFLRMSREQKRYRFLWIRYFFYIVRWAIISIHAFFYYFKTSHVFIFAEGNFAYTTHKSNHQYPSWRAKKKKKKKWQKKKSWTRKNKRLHNKFHRKNFSEIIYD